MRKVLFLILLCVTSWTFGQKIPLSHEHFDQWKKIQDHKLSDDGNWLTVETTPYRGDGKLVIRQLNGERIREIERGSGAVIGWQNKFFVAQIKPQYDSIRKLEIDKVKKEKWPKDTLWVWIVDADSTFTVPKLVDVSVSEKSNWLAYRTDENKLTQAVAVPVKSKKEKKKKKGEPEKEEEKYTSDGKLLTILNTETGTKKEFIDVKEYRISSGGNYLAFVSQRKQKKEEVYTLDLRELGNSSNSYFFQPFTAIGQFTWNEDETRFAFLASRDTVKKNKHFDLFVVDLTGNQPELRIDSLFQGMPKGYSISEHGKLRFAKDANRLFFGIAPLPAREEKDTIPEKEKAKLDVWSWVDGEIQPQQIKELNKKLKQSDLTAYEWESGHFQVLENDTFRVQFNSDLHTSRLLASNDHSYVQQAGWSFPWKRDYYLVAINEPNPALLLEGYEGRVHLAPDGNRVVYFDYNAGQYQLTDLNSGKSTCLTCSIKTNWYEDQNGQPHPAQPISRVYWEQGNTHVWIQSEFDVHRIRYDGNEVSRVTKGLGEERKQEFTVVKWDKDSLYLNPQRMWLNALDTKTKTQRVYAIGTDWQVTELYVKDADLSTFQKAKEGETVLFRQSTVKDYPELWFTNPTFENPVKLTETNPQQVEFNWSDVQLVEWKTPKGKQLQGLLYTPEDLDPTQSYPMLVYFYELNSDNLHRHWPPRPSASIIHPTEYASAGYVVFIPDVRYEPGKPAASAYDCIVSGTDYVLKQFPFIDSTRMGLQGQSWGGYQTAQLITMTKRYRAAMAGAPVSNMFSAYGGIRWGSGFSRMFQYEHTQSRIGATIWEKPELYVENSPLFHLPKVETPLLIMHNDQDGAVPWYQGIELFMGLRRLNKPVWMLNYNGDDHNLMKEGNRRDLSIRMKQFFDHYLMNQPAPKWLTEGVRAVDKGSE